MDNMGEIGNLLFQARMLKQIQRSGYRFLGAGRETVAEHTFLVSFISFVMAQLEPEVDGFRLVAMSLIHDLAEARTGDLDMVQKQYVSADEGMAVRHLAERLGFGRLLVDLAEEFAAGETREARLARDADQLAFVLDLSAMKDMGYQPASGWLDSVEKRLQTGTGRRIAESIQATGWDDWWRKNLLDIPGEKD